MTGGAVHRFALAVLDACLPADARAMSWLWSSAAALADLVLPMSCVGCDAPGTAACPGCLAGLAGPGHPAMPDPAPAGLPPTYAATSYDAAARAVLVAHKEHGRLPLARPLGAALASAVLAAGVGRQPVVLVPVPTSAAARRSRGHDPTARIARRAAMVLRRRAVPVVVVPALRHARRVRDSVGLTSAERAANLAGAFVVAPALLPRLAGRTLIVVDDVVTTGATLAESTRALQAAGARVTAAAAVAATVRRTAPAGRSGLHSRRRQV